MTQNSGICCACLYWFTLRMQLIETPLAAQWLRLGAPKAGGLNSIRGQGTGSHIAVIRSLHAIARERSCLPQLRGSAAKYIFINTAQERCRGRAVWGRGGWLGCCSTQPTGVHQPPAPACLQPQGTPFFPGVFEEAPLPR